MKVIERTRIIGAHGKHYVEVGDIIEVTGRENADGMVTIVTESGITGEVLLQYLGTQM